MYKTFLFAALVAVVMGQRNNKDGDDNKRPTRGETDFSDREEKGKKDGGKDNRNGQTKNDIKKNKDGRKCKPCKTGYAQVEGSCQCNDEASVAPLCKDGDVNDSCACADGDDAKCFYGYREAWNAEYNLGGACECIRPPTDCSLDCEKGQRKNLWDCECEDQPICEPCEQGFKQQPWTCECKSYYTMDMKCRWGGEGVVPELEGDQCMCNWTYEEEDKSKEAKCMRGYTASSDCSTCELEDKTKRIQCPKGQGWSTDSNQCVTLPDCGDASTECEEGSYFNKVECACTEKGERERKQGGKDKKGGKSGKDQKGDKGDKSGNSSDRRPKQKKEQKLNIVQ